MIYEVDGDFYTLYKFMGSLKESDFYYIRNNFTSRKYKSYLESCWGELKTENYIIQNVVDSFDAFRIIESYINKTYKSGQELGTIDTIIKDRESMKKLNDL